MSNDDTILSDQVSYYRARAGEYDEWWQRQDRYDQGDDETARWQNEVRQLEQALETFAPTGSVLELACGTGWWTQRLAGYATSLTCLDASIETIKVNQNRITEAGLPLPEYEVVDLFNWEPSDTYDVIFFSFWISHIPPDRFEAFWAIVARALKPGGRVFFIDTLPNEKATYVEDSKARNHHKPDNKGIIDRTLKDGRSFHIIKLFYDTDELNQHLHDLGWKANCRETESYFLLGEAQLR